MSDLRPQHHDEHLNADDALRAIAARLDASGASFARERAGLADRVFAASAPSLRAAQPSLAFPFRRWAVAAAAAVALFASVSFLVLGSRGPQHDRGSDVVAVRAAPEIAPMGRSEALLIALIDDDMALKATDGGAALDESAIALTHAHHRSVDDVKVELEELRSAGGRR
jgi:hypothetical protein